VSQSDSETNSVSRGKTMPLWVSLMIVILCTITLSASAVGIFGYVVYRIDSIERKRHELLGIARSAAALLAPAEYREIMASMKKNEYHSWLVDRFTKIMTENGLMFIHAGEIDANKGFTGFVEALAPGADYGADLGQHIPAANFPQEAFDAKAHGRAYATQPIDARKYVDSVNGFVVCAYAPVFDENGQSIAIVSAIMLDTAVYAASNLFAVKILGIVLLMIVLFVWVPFYYIKKFVALPVEESGNVLHKISQGDFTARVTGSYKSDFERIKKSVNDTAMRLSNYFDEKLRAERQAHQSDIEKARTEAAAEAIVSSIRYASRIQKNLLPPDIALEAAFSDYSVIWKPRDIVGGDIYWIKLFDTGTVLCVADCTGHGTPGALLTMLVVSVLESIVWPSNSGDTAAILWQLDQRLAAALHAEPGAGGTRGTQGIADIADGCDIAVLFIAKDGGVTLSSGHMNVFVCDGREVQRFRGQQVFVGEGRLKSKGEVDTHTIPASPDNKFYIASDGLYDQPGGEHGKAFGIKAFEHILLDSHNEKQAVIASMVWEAFEGHRGAEPRVDDVELIAFQP